MVGNDEQEINLGKSKVERDGWSGNLETLFGGG